MTDTLIIIGSHPRTRTDFDFSRTDCEIWMFNEAVSNKENTWAKRADAVFQMHEEAIWRNPNNRNDPKHYEWLTSQNEMDVFMQDVYPDVPRSVKYPLEKIQEMIGNDPNHFLTSSVPQAMALAALEGYKRVEIYGVAMESNTEYQWQREGVAYWLGFLKGRGVEVFFADETFHAPLYGYEGEVNIPYEHFEKRIEELNPQIQQLSGEYQAHLRICKGVFDKFIADASKENEQLLYVVMQKQCQMGEAIGILDGAMQENRKYKEKADTMREASGEYLFSRQEFESAASTMNKQAGEVREEFVAFGTQLQIIHYNVAKAPKGSDKRKRIAEEYIKQVDIYLKTNNKAAIYKGAAQENFRYLAWLDKHIRAAGGSKSEAVLVEKMQYA